MKTLDLNQMEKIQGEGWFKDACWGFAAGAAIYEAGALANIWNPIGASAALGMALVGGACLFA